MLPARPDLPTPLNEVLGPLVDSLSALGYTAVTSRYEPEAFGNFYVDFAGPVRSFRVVRDRGQYMLDGDRLWLESWSLWQAFGDPSEFSDTLLAALGDNRA